MQNWIIRFVETLRARLEATGCSIVTALDVELRAMDAPRLQKIREAAAELEALVMLEQARRHDDHMERHNAHASTRMAVALLEQCYAEVVAEVRLLDEHDEQGAAVICANGQHLRNAVDHLEAR